jgi:ketosteroid isomerase-like protein
MAGYSSDEDELIELNRRTFAAEDAHDHNSLRTILAEDFVIVRARLSADGNSQANGVAVREGAIQTKQQMLEAVSRETRPLSRHRHETLVQVYGDTAVVACRVELREASDLAGQFWNTQVYARTDEGWRCRDWRVTRIS